MNSLEIEVIACRARGGSHIDNCIKEAIALAMEHGQAVQFLHNDILYTARPEDLRNLVGKTGGHVKEGES